MQEYTWSKSEKKVARNAFEKAYDREIKQIKKEALQMLEKDSDGLSVWRIHDFLNKKRKETDHKYDYRYSVLLSVFSQLLAEGWLSVDDIMGLSEEKQERIKTVAEMIYK